MTTPAINSTTPTRIFQKINLQLEIETALLLEKFEKDQKANGRAEETISSRLRALKQVARQTNINNPEAVKTWLNGIDPSTQKIFCRWNNKTKVKFCDSYTAFLTYRGMTWKAPKYVIQDKIPFLPTEQEIDLLIAGCGKTTATVLQTLKETGMRIGELCILKWTDLDTERRTISITPEKGSNPRILAISTKLVAMLTELSKQHSPNIFQPQKKMLREYYSVQRKEIAKRLQNPRLLKITFHTFRHWKGTMEYYKTLDQKHVQYILGHKSIVSTDKYVHYVDALFHLTTDEWTSKVSHSLEEEQQLIEAGFQLVRSVNEITAIYKKRK
jgi:integrase